jgi:hypothetical protein
MVSCCGGWLAVRRAAAWFYVLGVKEDAWLCFLQKYQFHITKFTFIQVGLYSTLRTHKKSYQNSTHVCISRWLLDSHWRPANTVEPPLAVCMALEGTSLLGNGKGKGKFHPITGYEGPEGELRHNSTLSLTSAIDGVAGQRHAPAVLSPGKTRYPLYRRLDGPQGRSGQVRKISPQRDSIPGPSSQ